MSSLGLKDTIFLVVNSINNLVTKKPLVVSFEVTHTCTCDCIHCDKGRMSKDNGLIKPEDYKRIMKELSPPFIQISGGEPLIRRDVFEVIKNIKKSNGLPYTVFVTNASLLNEEKYLKLKEVGVDKFSISLDFPNKLHDDFRKTKGLYDHIKELIPYLASKYKNGDIAINSAITRKNFRYITQLAKNAKSWGVPISYSAYSILRTGNKDLFISDKKELDELDKQINELIQFKRKHCGFVLNSEKTLLTTARFFRKGEINGCMAGIRFLVVRPDGLLNGCSMFPDKKYSSHKELLSDFPKNNHCGQCFVAIRAYTSKSIKDLVIDSIKLN